MTTPAQPSGVLVTVYGKDGTEIRCHAIDARQGVASGLYSYTKPSNGGSLVDVEDPMDSDDDVNDEDEFGEPK